jgi:hypothetical protein
MRVHFKRAVLLTAKPEHPSDPYIETREIASLEPSTECPAPDSRIGGNCQNGSAQSRLKWGQIDQNRDMTFDSFWQPLQPSRGLNGPLSLGTLVSAIKQALPGFESIRGVSPARRGTCCLIGTFEKSAARRSKLLRCLGLRFRLSLGQFRVMA